MHPDNKKVVAATKARTIIQGAANNLNQAAVLATMPFAPIPASVSPSP